MKPEERIYRIALQQLDVNPQEAIFIDDRQENIEGANNLGIHTILFETPQQLNEELKKYT